jgi:hypothetical protein
MMITSAALATTTHTTHTVPVRTGLTTPHRIQDASHHKRFVTGTHRDAITITGTFPSDASATEATNKLKRETDVEDHPSTARGLYAKTLEVVERSRTAKPKRKPRGARRPDTYTSGCRPRAPEHNTRSLSTTDCTRTD